MHATSDHDGLSLSSRHAIHKVLAFFGTSNARKPKLRCDHVAHVGGMSLEMLEGNRSGGLAQVAKQSGLRDTTAERNVSSGVV